MTSLTPPDTSIFFSRHDSRDPRLGDLALTSDEKVEVAIIGYPDDEGIGLNGGKLGAAQGPRAIRQAFYRMTPHLHRSTKVFRDLGDVPTTLSLGERHELGRAHVAKHLQTGAQVLSFGGGNDYAYADGMGFLEQAGARPLIINVDAHFDVRDTAKGLSSGTPFFRLLESGHEFDFVELGIQAHCNARAHLEYVQQKGGKVITLEEILESQMSMSAYVTQALGDWLLRPRPTFLAIDMDAFAWPYAMGTSAAWPVGLDPHQFHSLLTMLLRRLNVRVLGLYEVSPPLDTGGGTAKLAAQWAHLFVHHV